MLVYKFCLFSNLLAISSAFAPHLLNGVHSATATATATATLRGLVLVGGNGNLLTAIHAASLSETEGETSSLAQTQTQTQTQTSDDNNEDDDDDEEWELEEFENLSEPDFYGSEWKIGTLMDGKQKITETWCRCVVKEDGQFLAIWGDGAEGKWNFDATNQFFSISKDTFGGWLGKQIWAGSVEDYYFMEGTVRGWSPLSPASVIGQWQMKRLGVAPDEAGVAPWFEELEVEDEDEDEDEENESSTVTEVAKETQDEENSTEVAKESESDGDMSSPVF